MMWAAATLFRGAALITAVIAVLALPEVASAGPPGDDTSKLPGAPPAPNQRNVTIRLDGDSADAPGAVCLYGEWSKAAAKSVKTIDELTKDGLFELKDDVLSFPKNKPEPSATSLTPLWDLGLETGRNETSATACTPEIEINAKSEGSLRLACRLAPHRASSRVAILAVTWPKNPQPSAGPRKSEEPSSIQAFDYDGTNITVFVSGKNAVTDDSIHVIVEGGDYRIGSNATSRLDRATLPLTPTCKVHQVHITQPMLVTGSLIEAAVTVGAKQVTGGWVQPTGGTFQLSLPHGFEHGTRKTLTLWPNKNDVLEATWDEADPSPPVRLRVRKASFEWIRHCLYAWPAKKEDECPVASITSVAATCTGVRSGETCSYECLVPENVPAIDLPAHLDFHVPGRESESWVQDLNYLGEKLKGFVPPPQRRVRVDLAEEDVKRSDAETPWPKRVILQSTSGSSQSIAIERDRLASAESFECTEHLAYFYESDDRTYVGKPVDLKDGVIELCDYPSSEAARTFFPRLYLGAGILISPPLSVRTDAIAQLSFSYRSARSRLSWTWLDVGYLFTTQQYYGVDVNGPTSATNSVAYNRILLSAGAFYSPYAHFAVLRDFYFGLNGGTIFGFATLARDSSRVGPVQLHPFASLYAGFNPSVWHLLGLELAVRPTYDGIEQHLTDFHADAHIGRESLFRVFIDLSARFGYPN